MAGWRDCDEDAGLKKVGTGTKTPVGGEEGVVMVWVVPSEAR